MQKDMKTLRVIVLPVALNLRFFRNHLRDCGVEIVENLKNPKHRIKRVDVLHFFSNDRKFILSSIKKYRPALVVSHLMHWPAIAKYHPYVYISLRKPSDLYKKLLVYSNNETLTKLYLKKIRLVDYDFKRFTPRTCYPLERPFILFFHRSYDFLKTFKKKLMLE